MTAEIALPPLFFLVAILYSSVGLGGGSSYTALMAIFGVHYEYIPTTSLILNLAVTSIGMASFWKGGHMRASLIFPFLVMSVPMSYLGGTLHLSRNVFCWLLLVTLIFVVVRIYFWNDLKLSRSVPIRKKLAVSLVLGGILGFIAGTVGIGGGVYLVPLIIALGLGIEKEAAAAGTVFIWSNSLVGAVSRVQRSAFSFEFMLPLLCSVIIGGFIGSRFGSVKFQPRAMQRIMGVVIIVAIGFLSRELL